MRTTGLMLATSSARRVFDEGWVVERKLDGIRAVAERDGDRVTLRSRTGQQLESAYPELVAALAAQPVPRFTVDGEIVAFDGDRTSFARLQQRMGLHDPARALASGVAVHYLLFDLLNLQGHDTTGLTLLERRQLLAEAVEFGDPLRLVDYLPAEPGRPVPLAEACARGWEGLIAKRAAGRYLPGRSGDWLKLKCESAQEFVVGGWTDPAGSRLGFGALLLGYQEDGRLRYAGKVGTGFDTRTLHALHRTLSQLAVDERPFGEEVPVRAPHWVQPRLVVQVAFTEWTRDGRLRAPRYQGVRTDRPAAEVVRERPEPA
ncbi:non-homologous end-joining DNA ligase [Streptomyces sp. TLI_171]|uniref:non-homologous end-joining DNA ligase n=1 Tax=Streptomyces sp. TLI_171 TaxID=1938859 RepID=UPI000C42E18C|nr:non-homologous end-joining DNA ligase [Streptomyces sp. TLI_171]RKE17640.1 bifunctional non-homologous end joining protein LigD [Streptomyces sp. TLI_171]